MLTYQDFLIESTNLDSLKKFIENAINDYKSSKNYIIAKDAENYARQQNTTILKYQKMLYTLSGAAVPDTYCANHKLCSNFFDIFTTQQTQFLLGNGVYFKNTETKDKLGGSEFDNMIQRAAKNSLIGGVSYGFFNYDHIEVFKATEFVPLYNEENGDLMAGIRFWQLSSTKPLRATLFELDGKTEFIKKNGEEMQIFEEKTPYILLKAESEADGITIYDGKNYPYFPIVPLFANEYHQSELVGIKGEIDAYDFIRSNLINQVDDASIIYWTLENSGGMDDIDLCKFIERIHTVHATTLDDDAKATANTIDLPTDASETALDRLEEDLYKDYMALDVRKISAGNQTATAIKAAYEPLNQKADAFEYQVTSFIHGILKLADIQDEPTYKRNQIINEKEQTDMVLSASEYLDRETILKHLPFLTVDEVENLIKKQ